MALEKVFTFSEDWHQDDRAKPLVRQYQLELDSVLKGYPELEDCSVTCCHCGIRFLTHPRNARRIDLRCPFGCRQHHRKQQANRRNAAYYRSEKGKAKKRELNRRRSMRQLDECSSRADEPPVDSGNKAVAEAPDTKAPTDDSVSSEQTMERPPSRGSTRLNVTLEMQVGGVLLNEADVVHCSLLPYLCSLAWLLEGRTIGRHELIAALLKRMRQRSINQLPHREYVRSYWNQHPP